MNICAFFFMVAIPSMLAARLSFAEVSLKINGSTTVNPVVAEAAEHFRGLGWKIFVDTQGGSSGGLSQLADGLIQIGMMSRPISEEDLKKFPKVNFNSHTVGYDGVAMIVSRPVYESGVKALSKEQLKAIYESKVKNWKEVGGFDRPIVFFNKEPGRGTWEVFAEFLYGRASLAPKVFHPEVGANQEARSKVGAHVSAISQLSAAWAEGRLEVRPLAILNDGKAIEPTLGNIKTGTYPLRRPLVLLTNGEPKGAIGKFIDYLRSPPGQQIVKKYGYVPLQ